MNESDYAAGDGKGRSISTVCAGPPSWAVVSLPGGCYKPPGTESLTLIPERSFKFLLQHGGLWGMTAGPDTLISLEVPLTGEERVAGQATKSTPMMVHVPIGDSEMSRYVCGLSPLLCMSKHTKLIHFN